MAEVAPLANLPIVVRDGDQYRSYAKVDLLDDGNGLLVYDYLTGTKLSRHSDGAVYTRVAGSGDRSPASVTIPFSQISYEAVRTVPIPADATSRLPLFRGKPTGALVFSSTVMSSNGTFAAEIVDEGHLSGTLLAWEQHPAYVSSQTWRPTGTGKCVILTILNERRR